MRKRTKSRLRKRDLLVALLCPLFSAFFGYLFWKDLNSYTLHRDDKERIATIEFKQRIAQRKFDDRVVWERIGQNAPLYDNDTIRTADFSEAVIHFKDGTQLSISENTMLQVSLDKDKGLQISVAGGGIQVASAAGGGAVSVKLDDGSVVSVDAGSTLAAQSHAGTGVRSVEVRSGSASVKTEQGSAEQLSVGESVSIGERGIRRNALTVLSPPRDVKLLRRTGSDEQPVVTFSWSQGAADDEMQDVVLETSPVRDFARDVARRTVSARETGFELPVASGSLYWRVSTAESGELAGEGRITLVDVAGVAAVAPLADGSFGYRNALPKLSFRWQGNEYAARYRLLVSATPDLRSPVFESETEATFISVDTLEEGSYYWQVTPYYVLNGIGYDDTGASEVCSFTIVRNEALRAPELSSPADGAEITYRGEAEANFMWKSELKDADYELIVARDADFGDIALVQTVSRQMRARVLFPDAASGGISGADGRYWWKVVRRSDDEEDLSPESVARSFTLSRYVPQANRLLYPPEDYSTEMTKLGATTFRWRLSDDYVGAESVLQIARDSAFGGMQLERGITGASSLDGILLPEGRYWWRIGATDAANGTVSFTEARSFTVLRELGAVVITAPVAGAELLAYGGSPVTVSWGAVAGADYYNVRVFAMDGTGERVIVEKPSVDGTAASFVLAPARYAVRVQPVAAGTETSALRTGTLAAREFTVRAPDPVRQLSPADGARFSGLDALREPTAFSWRDGTDTATGYEFVLYRRQRDGSLKVVESLSTRRAAVSLRRLTEGSYVWKVRASTADGFPLDSAEREFIIRAIPELSRPVLVTPAQDFMVDAAYLRRNRSVTFTWRPVAGANAYSFALYRRNGNGSLKAVLTRRSMRETQLSFSDLALLDVGDFVWNVTAHCYADDGYEEQSSKAATGVFHIRFELPKQVETKKPGKLYGE